MTFLRANWDRALAVLLTIGGGIALTLGFAGVADQIYPAAQIPYVVSGGLGGLFLLGAAGTLWLSADLRDEWRKLDALDTGDTARHGSSAVPPATNGTAPAPPGDATTVLPTGTGVPSP